MGALAPISGLLSSAGQGGLPGGGGAGSTPNIRGFFGLDPRFFDNPAGGTALFNNILFGASNQQVPIDFLRAGFYTGVPPIFGGAGFSGLPARFDLFAGQQGPVGVDAALALERLVRGGGGLGTSLAAGDVGGVAGNAGNKGSAAKTNSTSTDAASKSSFSRDELKKMSLGDLLKLLA